MDQWSSSSTNASSLLESPIVSTRASPLPPNKRAALLAGTERKVFFLHDEGDNSTLARLQTSDLAAELSSRGIVPYYRNGPYNCDGVESNGFDDDDVYGRSWLGQTKVHQDNAVLFLRNTVTRKGPFYGLIALGQTTSLGRLIAAEHGLSISTYTHQSVADASAAYPIIFLTSHVAYEFIVAAPGDWDTSLVFPVDTISYQLEDAINSRKKIFDFKRPSVDQLKTAKAMKKAAEARIARQKEQERRARRDYLINVVGVNPDEDTEFGSVSGDHNSSSYSHRNVAPPTDSGTTSSDDGHVPKPLATDGFKRSPATGKLRKKVTFRTPTHSRPSTPALSSDKPSTSSTIAHGPFCTMRQPLSNYLSNPAAEPVTPCPVDDLSPMIHWLEKGEDIQNTEEPRIDFLKGSILGKTCPGGGTAVDLCKMVVGPKGIKPVLDAVGRNRHIDKFLLGNNIIGDDGAKVVADFIRDTEKSKNIYNFYLAGNSISEKGVYHIADALMHNEFVNALWLKRNPLGPSGAEHIANMLAHNTTLQILDLVNTNIGDEGAKHIFASLSNNPRSAMKHIYIESSCCGLPTAQHAADYLKTKPSQLRSLYLNMSRVEDEGAIAIAESLKECGDGLEIVSLGSCRIGDKGAAAIAEALRDKTKIVSLDLGYRKGTKELGEKGNDIGYEGAIAIGDNLLKSKSLRSLNLSHNRMTYDELQSFVETYIVPNETLLSIRLQQSRGERRNLDAEKMAKRVCKRNKERFDAMVPESEEEKLEYERVQEALDPRHVKEIYSVYRGNM
ncbi:NLR, CARD domain-containing protein 3 [Tulasnella sp. 419]|nr:NLR, CARD domain-containing protein 3 [Tulasnella sp. 419]